MVLNEGKHTGEFILSEANGSRSRENVTVLLGENLKAGHVLGRRLVAPTFGAAAAMGTNVGNGAFGAVTMGANAGARRGTYRVVVTEPVAAGGIFQVFGPDGVVYADGAVGVAFDNEIAFTLADGAVDFSAGDAFTVEVSAGTYKYKEYDVAAADGGQRASGVLYDNVDATAADKAGVVIRRDAEIRADDLTWFAGATAAQKAIALGVLEAAGIIAR